MLRVVGSAQLQRCPAAVVVAAHSDPLFLINRQVFPYLPPAQQRFILLHEIGHWMLRTPSETAADTFALHATAGTEPDSLRSAVRSLAQTPSVNPRRTAALLKKALQIDKKQQAMKQILFANSTPQFTSRADGAETATPDIDPAAVATLTDDQRTARDAEILGQIVGGNNRRRLGLRVNNTFFTAETILLAAILATVIVIAARRR